MMKTRSVRSPGGFRSESLPSVKLKWIIFVLIAGALLLHVYSIENDSRRLHKFRFNLQQNVMDRLKDDTQYDVCVVGAGLSGTVFAERNVNVLNKKVLVVDSRDHIGGNCFDYVDEETGILMNKYGAHLFHTNSDTVWDYIQSLKHTPSWTRWDHKVLGWVRDKLVPIPVNIETVNKLMNLNINSEEEMEIWLEKNQVKCEGVCKNAEEMALSRVGRDLYELIFKGYTQKQWNKKASDLSAMVTARIPVTKNFDTRYFKDKYQYLPSQGYTKWFQSVLNHKNIDVALEVDYFNHREYFNTHCEQIVYTGPIDSYFKGKGLDRLEYRSIRFEKERFYDVGYVQENSVVNYPELNYEITRAVEYKHFLHQKSKHSVVVKEYPSDIGEPYYPVPTKRNLDLYEQYKQFAELEEKTNKVVFVGRLANYKYFNMDQAILNALELFYEKNGLDMAEWHTME